ncbi:hypothetical protein KMI_01g00440 [Encephalitozoon hellem]|nr:hypothetical protein KMI_01g00440 [Encephalitozoon hellem]
MPSGWNAKDLSLLAVEISRAYGISHEEIMSMDLKRGTKICYTRANGSEVTLDYLWEHDEEDPKTRFKLCLIETRLKSCTDSAANSLLLLFSTASKENQITIFAIFYKLATKYKVYDEKILHECRTHIHIAAFRQTILKILIAYSFSRPDLIFRVFTYEEAMEMNLFNPKSLSLENPNSISIVRRLFSNMDRTSFRHSKRILRDMDERFFLYLPDELSSKGYSHLRELIRELPPTKVRAIGRMVSRKSTVGLFLHPEIDDAHKFFAHKDIEVRIESLRHVKDVRAMQEFLEVNQFIYSRSMLKLLSRYFQIWLKKRASKDHELKTMYAETIHPMLQSRNTSRRLLGVYLMESLVSEGIVEFSGWAQLLFDPDYEIRKIGCKYSEGVSLELSEICTRIESYQPYDIHGCIEYMKNNRSDQFLGTLKEILDNKVGSIVNGKGTEEIAIHGFLSLFSEMRYDIGACVDVVYKYCFEKLSNTIYEQEDDRLVACSKNMNECCNYYYRMALDGDKISSWRLVQALLHINHLGVILQVSQYLNGVLKSGTLGEREILQIMDASFDRIKSCKVVSRKSGGMPLIFVAVLKNYPLIIDGILERLLELTGGDESTAKIHCLNVLSKVIGDGCLSPRMSFRTTELFRLAFKCSRSSLWAIRNVGIEMFSHLARKVFVQDSACIVSMAHKELRSLLYKELDSCYGTGDNTLAFLILHLYGRIKRLDEEEMKVIRRFSGKSGMIGLKSKRICEGREWIKPKHPEGRMAFDEKLGEGEILLRLLILLDSEHAEERKMAEHYVKNTYNLSLYSEEYLKHHIAKRICSIGYREAAVQKLKKYSLNVEESLNCFFRDSPSNERFDLGYDVFLMQKYKD